MDDIKLAIHNLQDSVPADKRRGKDVENALMQLHSTANLLKLSSIPPNTFQRISELLRQRLLPLYQVSLTQALQYSAAVLEFIQDEKLIPALEAKNKPLKRLWEQLLISLVSGVLDYLDQSPDTQSRESIASVLYPILIRLYFSPSAMFLSEINGDLLSVAYQLLVTTVEPQARNAARLRDHTISSKCLGLTLSQIRDFLAIESLLDIICILIPPIKNGVEKRSQFIKEVFQSDLFRCSKSILQILESIANGDWSITAVKIIESLATSDISFPQPFEASSLMICGMSLNAIEPFYVDKNGFLANLDQDGKLETLHIPFHTVTRIVGSSISSAEISIVLVLTMPPIIGTKSFPVPAGRELSMSLRLRKSQIDKFANVVKDRNLIFQYSTARKLSLPGTHISFNLPADKQPRALVSTQEKIHDMAKLLAMPSSPGPDHIKSNSPINQQSEFRDQKIENTTPSTKLVKAIVEDNAAKQTVFLDHNGNLTFTDPSHSVDKVFIQQFLEDSTLLYTSKLPRRPAQRSTKNQDDNIAVTSRVTRSNNITPQTGQKPTNRKSKKKNAPREKLPIVEGYSNLEFPQTTLDGQLDIKILSQGHSAVSVDVDKMPDSKVTISPSKTQKRRSATAGTMDKAITKPLDEPRREDRLLEINIAPVDLEPETKKRAIRNIEDTETIHSADQERPTKRVRIDPEKPSHPALPYQRKKYGRIGRISSPRAESPAIPIVDFDEIPDPKPTGVIERPNSHASAMNGKRSGRKTEPKPAAPKKRKQEHQDVGLDVKQTTSKVPLSLAKTKKDNQAKESLSEIDHHPVGSGITAVFETKPDRRSTSLTKARITTEAVMTQGHNENNARRKTRTAPWENKNFLQMVEGALDPIRLLSAKSVLDQKKDETWNHDYSLTLVVDNDDHEQDKKIVEPSTFEPDIVMIDLTTQDNPIPVSTPINVLPNSSLEEDIPVANVQLALPEKETQKVKVEISLPHHLPTKDRDIHRPSVSFASPVKSQRHPRTETSTPARKLDLDSKSHKIRKSREKSDHNKATSRGVHQQTYAKAEEKKYDEPNEPIERINEIIKHINEIVVHQISRRFNSVRDGLHAGHRGILQGTLQHLERMHEESTVHLANLVELEEEYALRCGNILEGFEDVRESSKNVASCVKNIVKEHNQLSLCKKFPQKLFDKRTGTGNCMLLSNCQVFCLWRNIFQGHVRYFLRRDFSSLHSPSLRKSNLAIMSDPNQYRLPTNVKAAHYDITVKTDLKDLSFDGIAKISLHVNAETSTITFNTSNLELGKATIYSETLKAEQMATFLSFDQSQERAVYRFNSALPAGSKAELKIAYAGKLTANMMGYYKSAWENKGKTEHYALTQFEATAARRAFPCWDEPLLKSTYAITMISRADTVNLSNMPVESEEIIKDDFDFPEDLTDILAPTKNDSDKWKITKFQTTPLMSSYLVAFANGPFEFLEASIVMPLSGKIVPLRIYTTPDVIHQAQFALDVKAAVLPLYEKIFDVEYPLPKLDTLVASDFDAGAMENWGLITGRTSAYLVDPKRADLQAKVRIATTQSHEVAHMWFGNITTMEWWNYLYLNEGFATLMGEVIIPDKVYPEWKVNSSFINEHLSRALELDAKPSSHPIEVDCPDANQIGQIFDGLSYSKAASVLRMLSNYVGEEKFLKGVSLYLKKKLYANSVTHDLWEGISTATGLDITHLMENWITKIGFPMLTVTEDAKGITVRQDRFLETGPADAKDNQTIWNIPLSLLSTKDGKSSVDLTAILQEREKTISLDTSQPFKLNADTVGVYRVLYTPQRLVLIAKEAAREGSVLSLNDRLGLMNDTMALSKAGLAKLSSALTMIDLWRGETEYLVWQGIGNSLSDLISIWWEHPQIVDKLNTFRRELFVPLIEKLGYEYSESESRDTSLLRTLAVGQASGARDEGVVKELKGRFEHYVETGDNSRIPADLQRVVFVAAVREGGRKEYDAVVKLHDKPATPTEKIAAIMAMGASQDLELLQETFNFISKKARDQDMSYYFFAISNNFKGRRLLTKYFQDNYDILSKRFEGNYSFNRLVTYSSDYYASGDDLKMIERFYKDRDTSKYNLALAQALDSIRSRTAYVTRSTDDLWEWESQHNS